MNPVLLKPGSDRRSQVVVHGPAGRPRSTRWSTGAHKAAAARRSRWTRWPTCAARYDVVICEGAGSPAEINLRDRRHRQHGPGPRGGPAGHRGRRHRPRRRVRRAVRHARPADAADQALVARLRGQQVPRRPDAARTRASTMLSELTGRPVLRRPALAGRPLARRRGLPRPRRPAARPGTPPHRARTCCGSRWSGCPRISNFTDVDALAAEPGVAVRFADRPGASWPTPTWWCCPAPGPRSPTWPGCATRGLAAAVAARAAAGRPVLGHLRRLPDARPARSTTTWSRARGAVDGLGLLPARVEFGAEKILGRPVGERATASRSHGVRDPPRRRRRRPTRRARSEPFLDGCRARRGLGHHLARRAGERRLPPAPSWPRSRGAGRPGLPPAPGTAFAALREERLDALATWSTAHLDTDALRRLIEGGPVPGLPALVTSLNHDR